MIRIRPHRKRGVVDGLEVDITIVLPDGTTRRERRRSPAPTAASTEQWAKRRERELFADGLKPKLVGKPKEEPTASLVLSRNLVVMGMAPSRAGESLGGGPCFATVLRRT